MNFEFDRDCVSYGCSKTCGTCCKIKWGVPVYPLEAIEIRNRTQKPLKELFYMQYNSIRIAKKPTGECIFLNDGCEIQEFKPLVCRMYPLNMFINILNLRAKVKGPFLDHCPKSGLNEVIIKRRDLEEFAKKGIINQSVFSFKLNCARDTIPSLELYLENVEYLARDLTLDKAVELLREREYVCVLAP